MGLGSEKGDRRRGACLTSSLALPPAMAQPPDSYRRSFGARGTFHQHPLQRKRERDAHRAATASSSSSSAGPEEPRLSLSLSLELPMKEAVVCPPQREEAAVSGLFRDKLSEHLHKASGALQPQGGSCSHSQVTRPFQEEGAAQEGARGQPLISAPPSWRVGELSWR